MRERPVAPGYLPKEKWGDGPWRKEPDRAEWKAHGVPCLAVRNMCYGNWCGYAGVAPGHPLHGVWYTDCPQKCGKKYCEHSPERVLSVHGGVTYANLCDGHICHVPKSGEPDNVFWFGFDAAHFNDLSPGIRAYEKARGFETFFSCGVYRDLGYVKKQIEELAKQLADMKP